MFSLSQWVSELIMDSMTRRVFTVATLGFTMLNVSKCRPSTSKPVLSFVANTQKATAISTPLLRAKSSSCPALKSRFGQLSRVYGSVRLLPDGAVIVQRPKYQHQNQ